MAFWSASLFDQLGNIPLIEVRDYNWLQSTLELPPEHFTEGVGNLDWENGSTDYSIFDPSVGYNTFGSEEINNFSNSDDMIRFRNEEDSKGIFWEDYVEASGGGVYIMTSEQLSCMQAVARGSITLSQAEENLTGEEGGC